MEKAGKEACGQLGGGNQMAPGERDHGLIGGLVPLGGRLSLGAEIFSRQQRVKDADTIEVKAVVIGGKMLEKSV